MLERLRQPGGIIGTLSLISALLLAVIGAAGAVAMVVSLVADSDFWSDSQGDKAVGLVFFLIIFAGSVGFVLMDRNPWGGAAVAVVGGLALAVLLFWAVLPIVIGLGAAVVAVLRARALHGHPHATAAGP